MSIRKIPEETSSFVYLNKNPKNKRAYDCVIRAISAACGMEWDDVYKKLFEIGLAEKAMMAEECVYGKFLNKHSDGKEKQLKKENGRKFTGKEFCGWLNEHFPKHDKNVVCRIGSGHMSVCMPVRNVLTGELEYKFHDIWDCTDGCVGNWWMVK